MNNNLQNLIDILTYELDQYSGLHNLLLKERNALVQMRIDDVYLFNKKKEEIILYIETAEIKRNKAVVQLAQDLNINQGDMSLSSLARIVPEEYVSRIEQLQASMNTRLQEIAEANSINGILIEKTEKFLAKCINLIDTICTPVSVYMPTGTIHGDSHKVGQLIYEQG